MALQFTLDTEERVGQPISFEADGPDAAVLLEGFACFYHEDMATIHISDGREWSGPLILGGTTHADSFDEFVASLR